MQGPLVSQNVVAAARGELTATGGDPVKAAKLLETTDLLLGRAAVEDSIGARRAGEAGRLAGLITSGWSPADEGPGGSLSVVATQAIEAEIRSPGVGAGGVKDVNEVLTVFLETDIPDARSVRGDATGQGDPSTNSLGEVATASIDIEEAQKQISTRFGDEATVTEVVQLAGGFSKETILVSTEGPAGLGDIVLRKVVPGRPVDHLPYEFEMIRFAWANGLPVPEPLWIELEPETLDAPFFVTRRAGGRNGGDVFGPYPGVEREVALDIAGILARLHQLDASSLGATPTVPMFETEQVHKAIDDQEELLAGLATPDEPYGPLWRAVLAWLRAHAPEPGERPVLVHADVGFHNVLISDTAVEALLDWERSHLGSAAQDLAYVRPSVESLVPWDEFLDTYRSAGGEVPDANSLQFFTVWQDTWRGIASLRLRQRFMTDPVRLSDAVAGIGMQPRFLATALQSAFGVDLPDLSVRGGG